MSEQQIDPAVASPHVAAQQQGTADWPKPGEEGYVHPDGTDQSVKQMAANRRAAADRAAAGSSVHGAPLATPGPDPLRQTERAVQAAEEYSGPTVEDAKAGVTKHVREGQEGPRDAEPADRRGKRDAVDPDEGKTTR
jgi:hypothetical protein